MILIKHRERAQSSFSLLELRLAERSSAATESADHHSYVHFSSSRAADVLSLPRVAVPKRSKAYGLFNDGPRRKCAGHMPGFVPSVPPSTHRITPCSATIYADFVPQKCGTWNGLLIPLYRVSVVESWLRRSLTADPWCHTVSRGVEKKRKSCRKTEIGPMLRRLPIK